MRVSDYADHDFRGWCATLDWIVQNLLGAAPLMDGHREAQTHDQLGVIVAARRNDRG